MTFGMNVGINERRRAGALSSMESSLCIVNDMTSKQRCRRQRSMSQERLLPESPRTYSWQRVLSHISHISHTIYDEMPSLQSNVSSARDPAFRAPHQRYRFYQRGIKSNLSSRSQNIAQGKAKSYQRYSLRAPNSKTDHQP